jgi:peptidyl-prolyl cis-trans isomerase D
LLVDRVRGQLGNEFKRSGLDEAALKTNALKNLVTQELIIQSAESEGFAANEQIIAANIDSVDAFKKDGLFSMEQYEEILRYQGMTPAQFEWQLQRDVISNQMKSGIILTALSTRENLDRIYRLQGERRRFDYLVLTADSVADQVSISDEDIEAYHAAHGDEFMTREQSRVQYIELDAAELELDTGPDEEQLQALYDEQYDQYVTPEERHARHILVSMPDSGQAAIDAARSKAQEIVGRLDNGEDFAAVAGEVSDDPATAASGGDLGFFSRGMMTPEFEDVAFSMKVGERSSPVQSEYGFHIIELLDSKPEEAIPFADVRGNLVKQIQDEARGDLYYEKAEELASLAFEQPDTLQGVADVLELDILESDWIGRDGGPGIGKHAEVVEIVYSDDVLQAGNNSVPVEIGENHVIVLHLLEHQGAKQQPLEAIRDAIRESVRKQKIHELLKQQGQQHLAGLASGDATLASIADSRGLTVGKTPLLARNAADPPRPMINRAFSLARPGDDKAVYTGFMLPRGDYALIALQEVKEGDLNLLPEEQRVQVMRGLNRILGASEMQRVIGALKAQAVVHIPGESGQ